MGSILCLFPNNLLYAASDEQSKTTPAAIDLDLIQEELEFLKEETVSIASLREQPISEAPSNVYVITDEDIRESGAIDIPRLFRRIPGMEVMQVTSAEYNVSVRGDNQLVANKLLVMIDGRSIYEDAYGSVFWTNLPITLPEIKRIEVLKGPAAALYGFNAVDGVINIITKSPEEMGEALVQVGAGELGTVRAAAIHAKQYEKFGYRLSVGHDQNKKWGDRDSLGLRQTKFNLHTQYALPSDSMIKLQGGFLTNDRFDGQTFETIAEDTTDITSGFVNGLYERSNFLIRGWWKYWRQKNEESVDSQLSPFFSIFDRTGNTFQRRERNTYNLDIQHALDFGTTHHLTYGMNLRRIIFQSNFIAGNKKHEDRVGLYFQEEWKAADPITIIAGLRMDIHSQINPTYSPRVSLVYKPAQDHSIRVTGAMSYRPPTLFETYIDSRARICIGAPCPGFFNFISPFSGNQDLKPERMISYDIEYQGWFIKHRLRFRTSFYYNQVSDLIAFTAPTPTNQRKKADILGGEAGIEFLTTSWLTTYLNGSYVHIDQDYFGSTRRGAPKWKFNGGLRGQWDNGLSGEAFLHYVASTKYRVASFFSTTENFVGGTPAPNERVGSYFLLNLRGAYQFWKTEVAVTASNALNDKHREHPLGDKIGSQVLGWVTLRY
jgi:iron complex outermembrane receptor protein